MRLRRYLATRPLLLALVFEGGLVPLALVLALLLGVAPWAGYRPGGATPALAVAATLPLVAGLALLAAAAPGHLRAIDRLIRPLVEAMFRGRGRWAVVTVAALAGLGEELLFRGVLQGWLAGLAGPWLAVGVAALVFGLAHYLSWAYFVLATAMGLYLGALYQLSGDLLLPTLVHALYDWIAIEYLLWRRGDAAKPAAGEEPPG